MLLRNKKGQGLMEYIIVCALIGIVCMGTVKTFGDRVKKRVEFMSSELTSNISVDK